MSHEILPEDLEFLTHDNDLPSYDKGCHRERSKANQPNHIKHWKKEHSKAWHGIPGLPFGRPRKSSNLALDEVSEEE